MSRDATLLSTIARLASRFMVPFVLIVFAVPFVTLLFYSLPATDDFCKASLSFNAVPQPSVLAITWLYYTRWSPRWLTTFLQHLIMRHVDLPAAYGWLLLMVIVTNLLALWYFFRSVFRFTRTTSLLMAAVFYAAWVASITHPTQQLYWLTGSTEYNLPLATLLILVGLLFRPRRAAWYYIALILLSIAVPAQHEIAGTFLCVGLFAGTVAMRMLRLPARQWYLSLSMAALSQVIVMLSPGNAIRAAMEHRRLWDTAHLPRWIAHSFYNGFNWLSCSAILVAALCIVLLSQQGRQPVATSCPPPKWLAIACLGAMFFILCESALIETATGIWLPPRVVIWFEFVFWLLFACAILTGVPELMQTPFSVSTRIGVFTLLAVSLLGSTNFRWAVQDLQGPAQAWWRINSSRLKQRGGSLEFEAPARYPNLTMPQLLTPDPGCWVNACLANYLQAKTVIVRNSTEECPH